MARAAPAHKRMAEAAPSSSEQKVIHELALRMILTEERKNREKALDEVGKAPAAPKPSMNAAKELANMAAQEAQMDKVRHLRASVKPRLQ